MTSLLMMTSLVIVLGGILATECATTVKEVGILYNNTGLDDKSFTQNVVFTSRVSSNLQCAVLCNHNEACVTFTFDEKVCRGHAQLMKSNTLSVRADGARTFARRDQGGDCLYFQEEAKVSGVATIFLHNGTPLNVYCDQDTEPGGWMVFQRRMDGSVNFFRNWTEYQSGFGNLSGEFWLGLDALHMLTSTQTYELRVDLMMWNLTKGYATYSNFSISDSSDNYRLNFDNFTGGDVGDSLSRHKGLAFSTKDNDNDLKAHNCAKKFLGAWWYRSCHKVNLNGDYKTNSSSPLRQGIIWKDFGERQDSLKFTEMKIRPVQ